MKDNIDVDLKNEIRRCVLDSTGLGNDPVGCCCESIDEPLVQYKAGSFFPH
jgi:hypothetical protein